MRLKEWLENNGNHFFSPSEINFVAKELFGSEAALLVASDYHLSCHHLAQLERIKQEYSRGRPLAYILGKEEFFGREFFVGEGVFIPRPETEVVVEEAVKVASRMHLKYILDLCCGTGCISIILDKYCRHKRFIVASDISPEALKIASRNIRYHRACVRLVNADLLSGFKYGVWELIVANPPYVEGCYLKGNNSLSFEPERALDGGDDGLMVIREIINSAHNYLKKGGYLVMEMGYNQKESVEEIAVSTGVFVIDKWIRDYSNNWRGVVMRNG